MNFSGGKIFYIGFQRVGTKDFGRFMELNGFRVASWDISAQNDWSAKYYDGRLNEIIRGKSFDFFQVFEDGPWFQPPLVKFLYHEFPDAHFVLLTRPAEDWFKSMVSHSAGLTIGQARLHCQAYDRLEDYLWLRDNLALAPNARLSLFDKPGHYMAVYRKKTMELTSFFERMPDASRRVFIGRLYDEDIYKKIAAFLGIEKPLFLGGVAHKTKLGPTEVVENLAAAHDAAFQALQKAKARGPEDMDEEIAQLRRYLEMSPGNQGLLLRLADIYRVRKDLAEAERLATAGDASHQACPKLRYVLALILTGQNRLAEAAEAVKGALELVDDNPAYHHLLAQLLRRMDLTAQAEAAQRRAVALSPQNETYRAALERFHPAAAQPNPGD